MIFWSSKLSNQPPCEELYELDLYLRNFNLKKLSIYETI